MGGPVVPSSAVAPGRDPAGDRRPWVVRVSAQRPSRLIACFAVVALVPLLLLAYFSINIAYQTVTSAAESRLTATTSIGAAYVEQQVVGLADVVGAYARGPTLTSAAADGDYTHYRAEVLVPRLADVQKAVPGIQFAAIIDPSGTQRFIVPANPAVIGVSFTYRDWFQGVMKTRATYVSEAYATILPGNPLVAGIASPILSAGGQVLALLLVGYRLDAIQSLVTRLSAAQNIDLTVTDQRGVIVAQPGTPPNSLESSKDSPGVAAALIGRSDLLQVSIGGTWYMRAYAPIATIGWTISASLPLSAALAGFYQLRGLVLIATAFLLAIAVAGLVLLGLLLRQRRHDQAALAFSESLTMEARVNASGILALNRAKDEMISTVSHELRTPLASLVGFTELLVTREYTKAEQTRYLTTMLAEGRRLTTLINDFLDLQKMESGRSPLALVQTDVSALVTRAVAAAGPNDRTPVVVNLPEQLPLIRVDPDTIMQVLGNLLSNARKYSPAGGTITVTASAGDDWVEISVQDSGLGIPHNALPRLFETFYRVDNSDRRDIAGTGLGLAICRRIVQSHGGTISIDSAGLGQGSRVTFTLPVARDTPQTGDVLLVEDDAGFAHLLEAELATQGLSAVWAADAETAEKVLEQMSARAVVLDLVLPGKQGEAFLEWLRRSRGTGLPIVVVTVKSLSAKEIEGFREAGVHAVLAKHEHGAKKAAHLIARALASRRAA